MAGVRWLKSEPPTSKNGRQKNATITAFRCAIAPMGPEIDRGVVTEISWVAFPSKPRSRPSKKVVNRHVRGGREGEVEGTGPGC
jgi:hypothetical protein